MARRDRLLAGVSYVVVIGVFVGAGFLFGGQDQTPATNATQPSTPDVTQPATTNPSGPTKQPPSETEIAELLNSFLEARIAGAGAAPYLTEPEEKIPLLYATTSGAPYERGEFERVNGYEWPDDDLIAFKVRLFAGDTVVEQLFFTTADADWLDYQRNSFYTDVSPTTEDGQPVTSADLTYSFFNGEVTLHFGHPWVATAADFLRLIPEGPFVQPTTDGGERNGWDTLNPTAVPPRHWTDCPSYPGSDGAEALAESLQSDPDLRATRPETVSTGGAEALMMDVANGAETKVALQSVCDTGVLRLGFNREAVGPGDRMRLYLFDAPDRSSMQILAIAIVAPESRFEKALETVAPVVESIEFHAP